MFRGIMPTDLKVIYGLQINDPYGHAGNPGYIVHSPVNSACSPVMALPRLNRYVYLKYTVLNSLSGLL